MSKKKLRREETRDRSSSLLSLSVGWCWRMMTERSPLGVNGGVGTLRMSTFAGAAFASSGCPTSACPPRRWSRRLRIEVDSNKIETVRLSPLSFDQALPSVRL